MKTTKKIILTLLVCVFSGIVMLSGCGIKLDNAPTQTAKMKVYGSVLVYDNYIYFANAFKDKTTLTKNDNDNGKVEVESLNRIALNNGEIEYDEETNLPKNIETAVSKITGFDNALMYSIDEYIFFASPSTHKSTSNEDQFQYNSYFRVNTDGTNLKEFYTSNNEVKEQSILKIGDKHYLFLIDGSKLIRIEIGKNIGGAVVVAEGFTSAVFAKEYTCENDVFAYFIKTETKNDSTEYLLNKVNILTNESIQINKNATSKEITLDSVAFGKLYFKINEGDFNYYESYDPTGTFTARQKISGPVDNINVSDLIVTMSDTNNTIYHVFTVSAGGAEDESEAGGSSVNVYALPAGEIDFASNLIAETIPSISFISGDYVYYAVTEDGIYRACLLDGTKQTIVNKTEFKSTNLSFDGRYLYFYAYSDNNATDTYYMYRADTRNTELGLDSKIELLSQLQQEDIDGPEDDE